MIEEVVALLEDFIAALGCALKYPEFSPGIRVPVVEHLELPGGRHMDVLEFNLSQIELGTRDYFNIYLIRYGIEVPAERLNGFSFYIGWCFLRLL